MTCLHHRTLKWGVAMFTLIVGIAHAQEEAVIKRATQLRAAPGDSASSVVELASNATVSRTSERQGAWIQVRAASGAVGWVHMFDIGAPVRDNPAAGALRHLGSKVSGGSSVSVATATAGIRGLGEGDVSRSTGGGRVDSPGEGLQQADRLRASAENARTFAAAASLQARRVESLPAPAPSSSASEAVAPTTPAPVRVENGDVLGHLLKSVESVTDAQEAELGSQMAVLLLHGKPLDPTPELQRYVNRLGRWLSLQSTRPDLPWTFVVVDESEFNAYSAPGGYVFVTRGLIDRCTDEAELAGILAHEIAHVINKHHLHAMHSAVRTGVPSNLAALVRHVHALGYGAQAEHAADREAVTLAARAGLDPFGLVSALVQVNALGDSDLQFADAHPQSRLRLDHLEQAMARRLDPQAGTKAAVTIEQRLESSTLK